MPDQKGRLVIALVRLGKVGQLLHQVRPVVGDGVGRVVAELVDGMDFKATLAQALEHQAIGATGEAVAMRKDDAAEHFRSAFLRGY